MTRTVVLESGVGVRVLVRGHGSCRNCNGLVESGAEELRGLDTGEDREDAKDEVTPHGSLVPSLEPLPSAETNCAHTVCTVVGILPADAPTRRYEAGRRRTKTVPS